MSNNILRDERLARERREAMLRSKAKERNSRSDGVTEGGRSPGGPVSSGNTGMEMMHAVLDRGPYRRGMAPRSGARGSLSEQFELSLPKLTPINIGPSTMLTKPVVENVFSALDQGAANRPGRASGLLGTQEEKPKTSKEIIAELEAQGIIEPYSEIAARKVSGYEIPDPQLLDAVRQEQEPTANLFFEELGRRAAGSDPNTFGGALRYNLARGAQGLLGLGEGIIDLGVGGLNTVASKIASLGGTHPNAVSEWFDQGAEYAYDNDIAGSFGRGIEEAVGEKTTGLGRFAGDLYQGAGQLLGGLGAGKALSGASRLPAEIASKLAIGASAGGGAAQGAYNEGADVNEATLYGIISGATETAIESISGGIPGLGKGRVTGKLFNKLKGSPEALQTLVDIVGEGGEEVLSEILAPYYQRMIYNPLAEDSTFDELLYAFATGSALSLVGQGGNIAQRAGQGVRELFQRGGGRAAKAPDMAGDTVTPAADDLSPSVPEGRISETASTGEADSTVVNTNPAQHTTAEQKVIDEYQAAVDENLVNFVKASIANKGANIGKYSLGTVSDRAAADIKAITGVDVKGFKTVIEQRMAEHIVDRHGSSGMADHTMQDINDIARMQYVLDNYDYIQAAGRTQAYSTVKPNGRQGQAQTVSYVKAVNGTYYVVEAVPNTNARTAYIVSAYMTQNPNKTIEALQTADAYAPAYTAETGTANAENADASIADVIIPQNAEKSNSELPPGTGAMGNPFIPTQERSAQKADAVDRQMPFHSRQSIMKDIIPEAESMRRAEMRIETDIEGEMEYLRSKAAWTGEDVDLAMLIKEKLGLDAIESGKYGAYRKWYKEVVGKQKSEAGRTLQAIQKWTRDGKQSAIELVDNAAEILEKNSAMSEAEIDAALGEAAVYALTAESQFADGNKEGLIDTLSKVATERGYKPSNKLIKALNKTNIDGIYDALWKSVEGLAFDQIPRSFGSKLSTYQYLSHLLNAKTLERNIIANAVFAPLEHHINNLAIIPDTIVSAVLAPIHHTKVGKMRSVGWEPSMFSKAGREGIANATRDSYVDIALDINRGGQGDKYQTSTNRVFKRKPGGLNVLNRAEGALGYGLNWTDAIQKGNTQGIAGAANQSLVNKGGRVTPELAERFTQDSMLTRSFQRETLIGNIAQAGKDWLNVVGIGTDNGKVVGAGKVKDFGLGDLVQKYTRVMGSLATSAAEYTPLGYAKALYNLGVVVYANTKSAKGYGDSNANMLGQFAEMTYDEAAAFAQRNFAISVTRPIVGLGLASACGALFKLGLLLLSDDDEYDKKSMMSTVQNKSGMQMNLSALGRLIDGESTAIQEDDVLINLDFLEPVNSIMRLGITMQTADDQSFNTQLEKSAEAVFGSVTSMPMMQNVKSVINTIKYRDKGGDDEKGDSIWDTANEAAAGLVGNSASGFIPGPIRHAAQAADNTVRDISDPDRPWMQVWNRLLSGVPGARNTLPEKLDSFGSPRKYTESGLLNALNATVIPGAAVQYRKDLVAEELERHDIPSLYPDRKAPNSISNDGEKYRLSSEQKRTYQTLRGRLEKDILDAMTSGAAYKGLSDEGKAEVISKAQGYAREFAKLEVLKEMGIEGEAGDTYRKAFEAVDKGMEPEDYFVYKQTEVRYDTDGNGELNTGELARSIEKSGLSGQAKSILWAINFPDWPQEAKELGVDFDVYTQFKTQTYGLAADKDSSGKSVSGSKKAKVEAVIDGLKLSREEKDALYLNQGYAESTLKNAPWNLR